MPQISRALFQRQSMTEVKELSEKLRNAYQEALAPFLKNTSVSCSHLNVLMNLRPSP